VYMNIENNEKFEKLHIRIKYLSIEGAAVVHVEDVNVHWSNKQLLMMLLTVFYGRGLVDNLLYCGTSLLDVLEMVWSKPRLTLPTESSSSPVHGVNGNGQQSDNAHHGRFISIAPGLFFHTFC
jgi:hypothetical protein